MNSNLKPQSNDSNYKGVEILSIGTELLLGNIVNTNAQWISEELSTLGIKTAKGSKGPQVATCGKLPKKSKYQYEIFWFRFILRSITLVGNIILCMKISRKWPK